METKYNPEDGKIVVKISTSELDTMSSNGLDLWLTPGSSRPYWASRANFMYDKIVATPYDFLEAAGYDSFDDNPDYEANDETLTIEIAYISSEPYIR